MKIPKKLKVGGLYYDVEITNQMYLGTANVSAEIMYDDLKIHVAPNPEPRMQADLLHETIHAIFHNLGYREHDEKKIDELAQALYAVIVDNPEMFAEEREEEEYECHHTRAAEDFKSESATADSCVDKQVRGGSADRGVRIRR